VATGCGNRLLLGWQLLPAPVAAQGHVPAENASSVRVSGARCRAAGMGCCMNWQLLQVLLRLLLLLLLLLLRVVQMPSTKLLEP